MSQHPSLISGQKGKGHRSVLKRYEKLKNLIEKDNWNEETGSVFSLPKIKSIRFKVKKEKPAAAEAEATAGAVAGKAEGAQPQAAQGQQGAGTKPAAGKAAPQKEKDKKGKA